jgi:NAD(P)-dependent dehydrogenase (short-subunit alcohol dehydrogenase family)
VRARPIGGRVVAVTGAARGIGLEIAGELLRQGALVAIGDIDEAGAKEAAERLGGGVVAARCDVADRDSFTGFLDLVERELGPLDVLVNNAGIMPVGPFHTESDEVARRQFDVNVHGVILGCKLALARMLPRGRGHLVNIASGAGVASVPGVATYCGTKHAVVGLTEAIRLEYRGSGIQATSVLPGVIDTALTSGLPETRGVPKISPAQVALAVAGVLRRPRARVFVPRRIGVLARLTAVLPTAAIEGLMAATGSRRGFLDADATARAGYEQRIRGA